MKLYSSVVEWLVPCTDNTPAQCRWWQIFDKWKISCCSVSIALKQWSNSCWFEAERLAIKIVKRSTRHRKVAGSRHDHWWQIEWPLTMAWSQQHLKWHYLDELLKYGSSVMDSRLNNPHAIKVMCGFRPISNIYQKNTYLYTSGYFGISICGLII